MQINSLIANSDIRTWLREVDGCRPSCWLSRIPRFNVRDSRSTGTEIHGGYSWIQVHSRRSCQDWRFFFGPSATRSRGYKEPRLVRGLSKDHFQIERRWRMGADVMAGFLEFVGHWCKFCWNAPGSGKVRISHQTRVYFILSLKRYLYIAVFWGIILRLSSRIFMDFFFWFSLQFKALLQGFSRRDF